jgi:hypothetical protein
LARIYQAASLGEADFRVAQVGNRGEADLLVHRVSSWGLAQGDSLWFVTRDRQEATSSIFMVSRGMAQLQVYFVDTRSEAGWVRSHRLHGRLG